MNMTISLVFGFIAGLLVNFFSDVLPIQRQLARPTCSSCSSTYTWKDYLFFSPCRNCGKLRSLRTLFVLLAGIVLSAALWSNPPAHLGYWLGLLVLTYFGMVVVIDFEHHIIMHVVTLAGAILGLLTGSLQHGLLNAIIGGLAGSGVMLTFYWLGTLFARYRAKKLGHDDGEEALGFGDVTISGVIGLMLGWPLVMYGLAIGVIVGGLASLVLVLVLIVTRRYQTMSVFTAYGPYLVFGAAILIFIPQALSVFFGK